MGSNPFLKKGFLSLKKLNQKSTVNTFNTGQWYHITVTYDGSSTAAGVKIYVDGVSETISIAFDTLTGSILTSEVLKIGGNVTPARYFHGKIASARMWDVELSPTEVIDEYKEGVKPASVQTGNLILNTDISHSTFNGSEWDIPDLTGITSGYQTVLMEVGDRVSDCP